MSASLQTRRTMIGQTVLAASVLMAGPSIEAGEEETSESSSSSDDAAEDPATNQMPQPGFPTLGGMQFWGDLKFLAGFKIQQNVLTGQHRLLDASNRRYVSGTRHDCESLLTRICDSRGLNPDTGHAVIYLHGIGRSSRSLAPIFKAMPRHGYVHVPMEYPSTRVTLEQSAEYLRSVITSLTAISKISFVVHSMGGLVVRRYLKDHHDPRLHRMVMLGTPNNGAELADMLKQNFFFRKIYGPAGQELISDPDGTIQSLPTPPFEFGIIAGGRGDDRGFNKLLPGDDDGTVTVASARLAGAVDYLRLPKIHTFLMSDPTAIAAVQHFLEHGRFFADRDPEPIVRPSNNAAAH
jgi:pimeloyl-ACP methyl ester carboxylesterase